MEQTLEFLVRHGLIVLFLFVLAEQIGLPLPAIPVLLAVGALGRTGHLDLPRALTVAVGASLLADLIWYEIGRRRGGAVLGWLCRIALEPDSCVRRTEALFSVHGGRALTVAKFVPGLNTAAPPLAGMLRMRLWRFLLFDTLGALLWIGIFVALGYAFSNELERALRWAMGLGSAFGVVVVGPLVLYLAYKFTVRARALRALRVSRVLPEQLKQLLDAQAPVTVVDLRHAVELAAEPETIPGAVQFPHEELEQRLSLIPRDRDIVLFCT